jgi:hypothetical protein
MGLLAGRLSFLSKKQGIKKGRASNFLFLDFKKN